MADGNDDRADRERIEQLEQQVLALSQIARETTATVAQLAQNPTGAPPSGQARTDGKAQRSEHDSEELREWVHWFVGRYELDDIPHCWDQHGAIIEELNALRVGWESTIGQGALGLEVMQWHDMAARALERLRGIYRTCVDGTHRPWQAPDWVGHCFDSDVFTD